MTEENSLKIPHIRRSKIMEMLHLNKVMSLDELQQGLASASSSTVRRDILLLQSQGQVILLRGGNVKLRSVESDEMPVEEKALLHKNNKERIARCAAAYVLEGETIYIDSGTTTAMMLRYLRDIKITIITSSTFVVKEYDRFTGSLIVLGGEVNKSTASIYGPLTDRQMSEMYFDRSFIGASAFSQVGGISTYDVREASKKRIAQAHSRVTYVLADSSKAGRSVLCKAFSLADCILITDVKNDTTAMGNAIIAP